MRDLRDPTKLGEAYLKARAGGVPISEAVDLVRYGTLRVDDYQDGGHISNDPEKHHSKTPQNLGSLDDGGT